MRMLILFTLIGSLFSQSNINKTHSVQLTPETFFGNADEIIYKVQDGDSLWRIAEKYKTTPREILEEIIAIKEANTKLRKIEEGTIFPNENITISLDEDNQTLDTFSRLNTASNDIKPIYRSAYPSNTESVFQPNHIMESVVIIFAQNKKSNSLKSGAGVIIDVDGTILTNLHIVDEAEDIFVVFYEEDFEKKLIKDVRKSAKRAKVGKMSSKKDLAIINVENAPINSKPIKFGSIYNIKAAENIFSYGHPGGWIYTYSDGIIKKIIEDYTSDDLPGFLGEIIATSTDSEQGDSGGPLCNEKGELIGITFSSSVLTSSTSLAISLRDINKFIQD